MRRFVPIVAGLTLLVLVFAGTASSPMPNEAATESGQARNQHPAPPRGQTESLDTEGISPAVRVHRPVFDMDYDDSWVASVPDVIGGYRVLYISTPKRKACSPSPVIVLQAPQESLSEFLGDTPDVHALMQAIPALPANARLSFGRSLIDKEEVAARDRRWNEAKIRTGCFSWGQVDLSVGTK